MLMVESVRRARHIPHHKQKLVLVWSAMRHFARELEELGYQVDYYSTQDNLHPALSEHMSRFAPNKIRLMETAEYGRTALLEKTLLKQGVQVEITPNNMFISSKAEFQGSAKGKSNLVMESFYRRMRRETGLLMRSGRPEGGKWNLDQLNRKRPPRGHVFPEIPGFPPDRITREVMELVEREFPGNFGVLEEFSWPVSREAAESFFTDFLDHRLDLFGPYEDAIVQGQRALYHSLLAPLLNIGLLDPLEICRLAESRYYEERACLQSVEGFIRQVIGWREFIYQVYHLKMPGYELSNFFDAQLGLPNFYWTGETRMACIKDAVKDLRKYGTIHHIQRLMVTGNFALIAGISPQLVNEWYRIAYVDAYDWVVTPNVLGLALYADGGVLATKPYAASANYINKMSDCCGSCHYDPKVTTGEKGCPFNSLYWDFLDRNSEAFGKNPRMNLAMANLRKRDLDTMRDIKAQAADIRGKLSRGEYL